MRFLSGMNNMLWQWLLPFLLTAAVLLWAVRLRGKPLCGFHRVLRNTFGSLLRRGHNPQKRAQYKVFASALAAMMGTGNLIGTAYALITGGAGAIFWMWISALAGMVLVYAENLLGSRYRQGTLGYLRCGVGSRLLTAVFAVCCTGAALGMGDLIQSRAVAETASEYGVPLPLSGLLTAVLLCVILCGGMRQVQRTAGVLVPVLCALYFAGCAVLLVRHAGALPAALGRILREAWGVQAAGSGISASLLLRSMRIGLQRGIFSNEAGLGSSALLHMDAAHKHPAQQSEWAAAEVFADTILCCTATALVVLTAPVGSISDFSDGAALLLAAFSAGLGATAGGFLALCMMLLAFATMIGWYACGFAAFGWLTGGRGRACFLCAYVLAAFAGALWRSDWLWMLCDLCNACMALPNLFALLYLGLKGKYPRSDA